MTACIKSLVFLCCPAEGCPQWTAWSSCPDADAVTPLCLLQRECKDPISNMKVSNDQCLGGEAAIMNCTESKSGGGKGSFAIDLPHLLLSASKQNDSNCYSALNTYRCFFNFSEAIPFLGMRN